MPLHGESKFPGPALARGATDIQLQKWISDSPLRKVKKAGSCADHITLLVCH